MGFQCGEMEDPYAAMAELARRPRTYGALVLSMMGLYREELQLIASVKRRWMHVEVWLTHTDGRAAALAEAMRMGADGLLTEDGLHRTAAPPAPEAATSVSPVSAATRSTPVMTSMDDANTSTSHAADMYIDNTTGEPVLSEEELRALLQEPPAPLPTESD